MTTEEFDDIDKRLRAATDLRCEIYLHEESLAKLANATAVLVLVCEDSSGGFGPVGRSTDQVRVPKNAVSESVEQYLRSKIDQLKKKMAEL